MDEYINREELDKELRDHHTSQRRGDSDWIGRMEKIKAGEHLVLYPRDQVHANNLKTVAYQAAKRAGIRVTARTMTYDGSIKLFLYLA